MPSALFVGAHPDDIEIGAGGTVVRLLERGFDVWWCILTGESDTSLASARTAEALLAAKNLAVPKDQVFCLGALDGKLTADRDWVGKLREVVRSHDIHPALVFTHTSADSHNDHRAAAQLTLATFRETVILHYGVVNSLLVSDFEPRFFIDTTAVSDHKSHALDAHQSQMASRRIQWESLVEVESAYGRRIGTEKAEGFEVSIQLGATGALLLHSLNDCPFHRFWYPLLGDEPLINIHGVPVYRRKKDYHWPADKDREGLARLRRAFKDK